jgi:hypothetical protein
VDALAAREDVRKLGLSVNRSANRHAGDLNHLIGCRGEKRAG